MRIRRRPQAQALSLPVLQPSDPSTAPQPPPNARRNQPHWLLAVSGDRKSEEEEGRKKNRVEELHHLHTHADLGDEPSAALPLLPQVQGNVVGCSESPGGVGGGGAQRLQGAADGHRSLENGHRDKSDQPAINAGERLVNGTPAMPVARVTVNMKEEIKNDSGGGAKKRRGPAVLMEGSRCSRVNGRGWRCSQPTLVGYSLCEHHLGKGRTRSSASANGAAGRGGTAQLGRTDPSRKSAAAVAVVTAAPSANDPPSLQHF